MEAVRRRYDLGHAAGITPHKAFGIPLRLGHSFLIAPRRTLPVVHGAGQHQPDARVMRGPDHGLITRNAVVVQVKEITDRRHAAFHHFAKGEERTGIDILHPQLRRIFIEGFVPPFQKGAVRSNAPQQALKAVVMGIDGAGHQRELRPGLHGGIGIGRTQCAIGTHRQDIPVPDRHRETGPIHAIHQTARGPKDRCTHKESLLSKSSTASSSTCAAWAISSPLVSSCGQWLRPSMLCTKSIADFVSRAILAAS